MVTMLSVTFLPPAFLLALFWSEFFSLQLKMSVYVKRRRFVFMLSGWTGFYRRVEFDAGYNTRQSLILVRYLLLQKLRL